MFVRRYQSTVHAVVAFLRHGMPYILLTTIISVHKVRSYIATYTYVCLASSSLPSSYGDMRERAC